MDILLLSLLVSTFVLHYFMCAGNQPRLRHAVNSVAYVVVLPAPIKLCHRPNARPCVSQLRPVYVVTSACQPLPASPCCHFIVRQAVGLSNDGRINDGCVMVRSVSRPQFGERLIGDLDRPVNSGFVKPAPRTNIGFDARPHLFNNFFCVN